MRYNTLIIYDISSDRLRDIFVKEMLLFGIRTQKSVFEAKLTESELKRVKETVRNFRKIHKEPKIDIYIIEEKAYNKALRLGKKSQYLAIDDLIII